MTLKAHRGRCAHCGHDHDAARKMAEYRAAATHPQSPASPLPEAAEPVGDPFAYLIRRLEANTAPAEKFLPGCRVVLMDQARAFIGATRFEAQAPAQAGEVARPGPSGDVPSDFQEGQWWLQKLDEVAAAGTDDFKRAVAVVRNLMRTAHAQVATPPAHPVLAPVVREPLTATPTQFIAAHTYLRGCEIDMSGAELDNLLRIFGIQATTGEQSHGS